MADRRNARNAIADAEFDLVSARTRLQKIRDVAHEYQAAAPRLEERVKTAIGEVVATAIDPLLVETEALKRQLDANYAVLRFLSTATPAFNEAGRRASLALPSWRPGEPLPGRLDHPATAPWRAALEGLANDADTPLPR